MLINLYIFKNFNILVTPMGAMHTKISVLNFYPFDVFGSLRMTLRCRSMYEINLRQKFILLSACVGLCINYKNMRGMNNIKDAVCY